ncbi:MAG: hypothetical protein CME88_09465 [Hirschia sp.]|nr:hypothetical protein [Hirschia sp.]MBF18593.1 hypothetical protein [Hirschia sp.]
MNQLHSQVSDKQKLQKIKPTIWFQRKELDQILRVYGRMVSAGEWRDYAIDGLKDRAVFSIFRRSSEAPSYVIEKRPDLARRQGAYAVINATGQILKRGHELSQVLRIFDKRRFDVIG